MHLDCNYMKGDNLFIEDELDSDGDVIIVVEESSRTAGLALSKSDAKKLAEHILHLLEESK